MSSLFDDNVFIGYHTVEQYVVANISILQKDTVFHNRTAPYVYATEDDGVFDLSLYGTTVGNHAVADFEKLFDNRFTVLKKAFINFIPDEKYRDFCHNHLMYQKNSQV